MLVEHCYALQHNGEHCNTLQHTASTLQHTSTDCNTLQYVATTCHTPHLTKTLPIHNAKLTLFRSGWTLFTLGIWRLWILGFEGNFEVLQYLCLVAPWLWITSCFHTRIFPFSWRELMFSIRKFQFIRANMNMFLLHSNATVAKVTYVSVFSLPEGVPEYLLPRAHCPRESNTYSLGWEFHWNCCAPKIHQRETKKTIIPPLSNSHPRE